MKELIDYMDSFNAGPITETTKLTNLLETFWSEFAGSTSEGMTGNKLRNRIEDVNWNPPMLSFSIERHGATVLGSSRAEYQSWEINFEEKTASFQNIGYKQIIPKAPRMNLRPIAEEIAHMIMSYQEDSRLIWKNNGTVTVKIGKILPTGSAVKQTLAYRRKRFRKILEELLSNSGWNIIRPNVFTPPDT
jgi:hypothetical protein